MNICEQIHAIQADLEGQHLSGWLIYDFRRSNLLAAKVLAIPDQTLLTRRYFYWIPANGLPLKLVHRIESHVLDHLPGVVILYSSWIELEERLREMLLGAKCVAMEYSPHNAIPYISCVDGGTIELVKQCGVTVVSSADFLQTYTAPLNKEQIASHFQAARVLDEAVAEAWKLISEHLLADSPIDEYSVQQFLLDYFAQQGCITCDPPICAVNTHSADPHYTPTASASAMIREGDFILIDLWCKLNHPDSVYADITRVAIAATAPTPRQQEIFDIVKEAGETAIALVKRRFLQKRRIEGWEVDKAARDVIASKGYGSYFIHRTGHNISQQLHGAGAHMDNYETHDTRPIIPHSCFSIEPGIYLPGEFGVRLECDIIVDDKGGVHVTGHIQQNIECLRGITYGIQ